MTEVIVWSGWVGGLAVGVYLLFQLALSGRVLGVSTGFGNICALASDRPFFRQKPYDEPTNWRLWFTLGIPLGGVVALWTSPGATWEPTFAMGLYDTVLPSAPWAKAVVLVIGGIFIGYGSRAAGGCTSGHSISGLAMLNPPSLVASLGFFAGGIVAVQVLFRLVG